MNAQNKPFYISGRERTNPPTKANPTRYQYLSLKDAEPNLGIPLTNALPASATWVLTTDALGNRYFSTTLLYDSTYSTLKGTSADFVSVFTTVQRTSGNWQSTYTTLKENSGTWLTVTSANSLYFKTSGGLIEGDLKIQGNVLIVGALSALSGLEFITTKATTTSSLSIVNVGFGPALYVSQDGFYDIAKFYDAEGGIAMLIGNITPPGTYSGVVGIKTEYPNKTLTVVGDISSTQGFYTEGPLVSAGVTLDTIIFNAVPPTLQSVYATVSANSGSWTNVYNAWSTTSSQYVTYNSLSTTRSYLCAADVFGDVFIYGNLVAQGSAFFTNTIVSVTSALSVINSGSGPALFVSQGKGFGDIAQFFDADYSSAVLHIGNAVDISGNIKDGVIGIKTDRPNKTLTVVGEISSTGTINDAIFKYNAGNVLIGKNIKQDTSGINNVIVGDTAGSIIDFGQSNVLIGHNAGANIIDGSYNVLIGENAGGNTTQATSNVFIGNNVGPINQTGNFNIGLGRNTLVNHTLGTSNIALGNTAGTGLITGNYNIIIGSENYSDNTSRSIVIGNNARASKDFQAVIGDPVFPFVDGIYYGNFTYYGILSAEQTRVNALTAWETRVTNITASRIFSRHLIDGNIVTVSSGLTALGRSYITNLSAVASSNNVPALQVNGPVLIFGPSTMTGGLSVTERLSAGFGFTTATGNYLSGTRGRATTDLLNIFHDKNEGISVYSSTNLNSGFWQSSYTTMTAFSARWEEAFFDTQAIQTTLTANPPYGGKQVLLAGGGVGSNAEYGSSWQFDKAYALMAQLPGSTGEYDGGYGTGAAGYSFGGYILTESGPKSIGYRNYIQFATNDYNKSGYNMNFSGFSVWPQIDKGDRFIKAMYGNKHCFLLSVSGALYGTGYNNYNQLGLGPSTNVYQFQKVDNIVSPPLSFGDRIIDIQTTQGADDRGFSYFLTLSGFMYATGENAFGVLGQGNTNNLSYFTRVEGGACGASAIIADPTKRIVKIAQSQGGYYGCIFAIDRTGRVYSCGNDSSNSNGKRGNGASQSSSFVQTFINGNAATPLIADDIVTTGGSYNSDYGFSVALKNGLLYFTGYNDSYGYAGDGNTTHYNYFYQTTNYSNLSAIQAWATGTYGNYGTLFVACGPLRALYATGNNNNYIMGIGGGTGPYTTPQACMRTDKNWNLVGQLTNVKKMAFTGYNAPCLAYALTTTGELYVAGNSTRGTNGLNMADGVVRWFYRINFDTDDTRIQDVYAYHNSTNYTHVHALDNYGRVWGWGNSSVHQLGTIGWGTHVYSPHIIWPDA